jgi:chromosome segregation ATPase
MAADSVDLQSELNAVKGRLKEVREEHDKAMSHISTLEVEVWRLVEERDNAKADMLLECLRYYDNTDHKISLFDWMTRREKELRKPIRRRHNEPRTR